MRSRSIVIDGDEEHRDEREDPEQRAADAVERARAGRRRRTRSSAISTRGTTSRSATVRGSWRSCGSTRPAVASVIARAHALASDRSISAGRPRSRSSSPVRRAQLRRRVVGEQMRRRASAAAGRSGRPRPSRGWRRAASCPASASAWNVAHRSRAQHRVEADRRLVEDEQLGLAEQRRGERDPRPLPAGEVARRPVGVVAEADRRRSTRRPARRRDPSDAARSSAGSRAR